MWSGGGISRADPGEKNFGFLLARWQTSSVTYFFVTRFRKLYAELCQGIVDIAISSVFPPPDAEQQQSQPAAFIRL